MRRVSSLPVPAITIAAVLSLAAPAAQALGIGASTTRSSLGRPLDFAARVQLDAGETLAPGCVAADVTVGDRRLPASAVRVALEPTGDRRQRQARVTTTIRIDEPVVAVDLTVGCNARVRRRFVGFIDPPRRADTNLPAARAAADARTSSRAASTSVAPAPERSARVAASPPATPLIQPPPPTTTTPSPAASGTDAATAMGAADERVRALTAEVAAWRQQAANGREAVNALQDRLRRAERERIPVAVVAALGALSLVLALVAAVLWWLRPRRRRPPPSAVRPAFAASGDAGLDGVAAASGASSSPAGRTGETRPIRERRTTSFATTGQPSIGGLEVTTVHAPPPLPAVAAAVPPGGDAQAGSTAGDLSMEELIDLEQQVEFFSVLGQDDAAVELLVASLERGAGASPLPYLQLLEIQRRQDDEAGHARTRAAYARSFGVEAPAWDADLHAGRSLEDHPQTLARLQALWPTPLHAMKTLGRLLLRADPAAPVFDPPACRELLFLYAVAREHAGHVETDFGSIDLFLPLEDAGERGIVDAGDSGTVDFDVTSWQDDEPVVSRLPP